MISGSLEGALHEKCNTTDVRRAIYKIGINILASFCKLTPILENDYAHIKSVILDNTNLNEKDTKYCGFIPIENLVDVPSKEGHHTITLQHDCKYWHIHCMFYGGSVGTFCKIQGQNQENWVRRTIFAPIGHGRWTDEEYPIFIDHLISPVVKGSPYVSTLAQSFYNVSEFHNRKRISPKTTKQ